MKNEKHTLDELLRDDFFLKSVTRPQPESTAYWDDAVKQGVVDRETLEEARRIALLINANDIVDEDIEARIPVIWNRIENSISPNRGKLYIKYISVAASIAIIAFLTVNHFVNFDASTDLPLAIENRQIEISNDIQLITGDDKMTISGDVAEIDYSQKDGIIVNNETIDKKKAEKDKLQYNQLIVPYGKRSSLILSDGSKIWVNAGTRVIYPVEFGKSKREISIDGEIYGDFARDPDRPFTINARDMEVQILGTQINIQAYRDDNLKTVVLVTGAVNVKTKDGKSQRLSPNQMITIAEENTNIQTINVLNYISWKDGYYQFRNEKLGVVLSRLSRYYGVKIECDTKAAGLHCSGGLFYQDDILQILDGVCLSAPVRYEMKDDKYIFSINQ